MPKSNYSQTVKRFNLSDLNGQNGFVIHGVNSGDNTGFALGKIGDINGDDIDDLLISAYAADNTNGRAYVVYGSRQGFQSSFDLSTLNGGNGFVIDSVIGLTTAFSVNGIRDVNNDGIDDFAFGSISSQTFEGLETVIFGRQSPFPAIFNPNTLSGSNGFSISGGASDLLGYSRSCGNMGGDFNNDGIDDFIFSAPNIATIGEAYILFGKTSPFSQSINVNTLNGANGFTVRGEQAGGYFGLLMCALDDINGDEIDDFIIGMTNGNSIETNGAYVIYGKSGNFIPVFNITQLDGNNGFAIQGSPRIESFLGSLGDINGDSISDFAVDTARGGYVIFGSRAEFSGEYNLSDINGSNGFVVHGYNTDGGFLMNGIGDLNNDGVDDMGLFTSVDPVGDNLVFVLYGGNKIFQSPYNISNIQPEDGFAISGDDISGLSSLIGDVDINGDGISDVIIGVPTANDQAGKVYVVFGPQLVSPSPSPSVSPSPSISPSISVSPSTTPTASSSPSMTPLTKPSHSALPSSIPNYPGTFSFLLDLDSLDGTNGFAIYPPSGTNGMSIVGKAGDFNKDGYDDIFLGSPGAIGSAGQAYLIFGKPTYNSPTRVDSLGIGELLIFEGNLTDVSGIIGGVGSSLSTSGDINGDGFSDLIIGGFTSYFPSGASFIAFGGSSASQQTKISVANLSGVNGFKFTQKVPFSPNLVGIGYSVAEAGDINGDNLADVIIGSLNNNAGVYALYGSREAFPSLFNASNLDGINGFTIKSLASGDRFGSAVSSAGDINGDGVDDIIVGAPYSGTGNAGQAFAIYGNMRGFSSVYNMSSLDGNNGFIINGSISSQLGNYLGNAGDLNGDGYSDIIIGAPYASPDNLDSAGCSYIIFGRESSYPRYINTDGQDLNIGITFAGGKANDNNGVVKGIGDINFDGYDDVASCSPNANGGKGECYVIFGSKSISSTNLNPGLLNGTNGFTIRSDSGARNSTGASVAGLGDINGDGVSDFIISSISSEFGISDIAYVIFGRKGEMRPSPTPNSQPSPSSGASIGTIVLNQPNQIYNNHNSSIKFEILANNVTINSFGDRVTFKPVANPGYILTINGFDKSTDIVDLTDFFGLYYNILNITQGSAIVNLPSEQKTIIKNLNPSDLSASNFDFYDTDKSSDGLSAGAIAGIVIGTVVVSSLLIALGIGYYMKSHSSEVIVKANPLNALELGAIGAVATSIVHNPVAKAEEIEDVKRSELVEDAIYSSDISYE